MWPLLAIMAGAYALDEHNKRVKAEKKLRRQRRRLGAGPAFVNGTPIYRGQRRRLADGGSVKYAGSRLLFIYYGRVRYSVPIASGMNYSDRTATVLQARMSIVPKSRSLTEKQSGSGNEAGKGHEQGHGLRGWRSVFRRSLPGDAVIPWLAAAGSSLWQEFAFSSMDEDGRSFPALPAPGRNCGEEKDRGAGASHSPRGVSAVQPSPQ